MAQYLTIQIHKFPNTAHTINTTIPQPTSDRSKGREKFIAAAISVVAAIFALYILEAALTFGNPRWIDKLGTTLRVGPSVVSETMRIRASNPHAYPFLQPDTYTDSSGRTKLFVGDSATLPLSGQANTLTILCNESGTTIGYRSDSLGFRNPADIWEPIHSDVALIGDSFMHGFCRPEQETIAAQLRAANVRALNLGLTGAGPLAELGILREYLRAVRPKRVYWLFYEGNDLVDIKSERETLLLRYLSPDFNQNLLARRGSVDSAIVRFADSLLSAYQSPTSSQKIESFMLLRKLRTATGLYRSPAFDQGDEKAEAQILESVLSLARTDAESWGGELRLVYLPERRRFNRNTAPVVGESHDPVVVQQRIRRIVYRLGIPMIDVASVFAAEKDPASLWNARRYHYNAAGYALVAKAIIDDLRK